MQLRKSVKEAVYLRWVVIKKARGSRWVPPLLYFAKNQVNLEVKIYVQDTISFDIDLMETLEPLVSLFDS